MSSSVALYKDPKRILLPPLVILPHLCTNCHQRVNVIIFSWGGGLCCGCQVLQSSTQMQTRSKITPSGSTSETQTFASTPCAIFTKKDDLFYITRSGGGLIGSWDLRKNIKNPKWQILRFKNLPADKDQMGSYGFLL